MIGAEHLEFYAMRAEQERLLAKQARAPHARRIHSWLADHYSAMLTTESLDVVRQALPAIRN